MGSVSRVFVAQLVGLPVFGPDGESIGKIRDVVASLRTDRQPPRVLGAVVELATRRRIFVPMLRVTSIDANAVTLATGSVNLRRFHQRPNEVLVVGQLLDARVLIAETEAVAVRGRRRDGADPHPRLGARPRRGPASGPAGSARRGPIQVLRWEEVRGPGVTDLSSVPQGTDKLLAVFDTMRAADVAAALQELPAKRRYEVADGLDDERLADVFEELPEDDQKDLLAHLDEERAADILEAMDPDDAADLLAELSELDQDRLLELMESEESDPVRRLLAYSADTAGGLMTPEPIVLAPDATIAEALAMVRNPDITPALASMVFVCRPAVRHADRPLHRLRAPAAAAARAAVRAGRRAPWTPSSPGCRRTRR